MRETLHRRLHRELRRARLPIVLTFFEIETLAYLSVNRVSSLLESLPLMTPEDERIEVEPRSLWLYLSFVPYCLLASYDFGGARRASKIFGCLMLSSLVAYRSFLRAPSSYPRPRVSVDHDEHLRNAFAALHAVDRPSNTFPSIHVSHTALLALMLCEHLPKSRGDAYLFWASAISLSTLLTKQHYIVDISGGVVVAERISQDIYVPWCEGRLSLRQAAQRMNELCDLLDRQVASPRDYRLKLEERHPRIRRWADDYVRAGGFAALYLQTGGRHSLLKRRHRLNQALEQLNRTLRIANTVMPGWLQFVEQFRTAAESLDDRVVYEYLCELDDHLAKLLPLVFDLEGRSEGASTTTPANSVGAVWPGAR
jgi:hypothetical protein